MTTLTSYQIKKQFLDFFKSKQHLIIKSASLLPQGDPSLLFINSGMNPFKSIFLGDQDKYYKGNVGYSRIADSQRCIRVSGKHNDLEAVGYDCYHHTLFEMLGNWSFGDYYKKEAIMWAWELLTEIWKLPVDRLYVTVFSGSEEDQCDADDEAEKLWMMHTNINPNHILRFGKKDNFWEMGATGPCGPCSEIHIDMRSDNDISKKSGIHLVNQDHPEVIEIWNLVFIAFNRTKTGHLEPLKKQYVDTGMGLERVCAVLQNKISNYDTDLFMPIIQKFEALSGYKYGNDPKRDIAFRVNTDHIRALYWGIIDGILPSNEGRGYVLRRLLRRALRYGRDWLGFENPYLHLIIPVVKDVFKDTQVHDISQKQIKDIIKAEEEIFFKTLTRGVLMIQTIINSKSSVITGKDAFILHDRYGFPIDLTLLIAKENNMQVDVNEYEEYMNKQRKLSKPSVPKQHENNISDWKPINNAKIEKTIFLGYNVLSCLAQCVAYRKTKKHIEILLDKTPFYAESGGQVGDIGQLKFDDFSVNVIDVQKQDGFYCHIVENFSIPSHSKCKAIVNPQRRKEITKHHSATHILHACLRQIFGKHVMQKGSYVSDKRLRFDFTHHTAIEKFQLDEIVKQVNRKIQENISCEVQYNVPIDEAKKQGALMFFEEKYISHVRTIAFDRGFSYELCGGTHVQSTGEIGCFYLDSITSVAAGIKRIEAKVGKSAINSIIKNRHQIENVALKVGGDALLEDQVSKIIAERKQLQTTLKKVKERFYVSQIPMIIKQSLTWRGIHVMVHNFEDATPQDLKYIIFEVQKKQPTENIIVFASTYNSNQHISLIIAITQDVIQKYGLNANKLLQEYNKSLGCRGGGHVHYAQAGGKNNHNLKKILSQTTQFLDMSFKL